MRLQQPWTPSYQAKRFHILPIFGFSASHYLWNPSNKSTPATPRTKTKRERESQYYAKVHLFTPPDGRRYTQFRPHGTPASREHRSRLHSALATCASSGGFIRHRRDPERQLHNKRLMRGVGAGVLCSFNVASPQKSIFPFVIHVCDRIGRVVYGKHCPSGNLHVCVANVGGWVGGGGGGLGRWNVASRFGLLGGDVMQERRHSAFGAHVTRATSALRVAV